MMRSMRVVPAAALLLLAVVSWADEPAGLDAARMQAAEAHKPLLIKFGSEF